MNRVFFCAKAAVCMLFSLAIQSVNASDLVVPIGVSVKGASVEVLVAPSSVVIVDIESECISFEPGVYARYAQKYLGVRAPLIAKNSTEITSARIAKQSEGERSLVSNYPSRYDSFGVDDMIQIDLTSADALSTEEAAAEAAAEIFKLRRLRRELLSGDLGEGFYGGGLRAALDEIDKLEVGYTALFMGRTTTENRRKSFSVSIADAQKRYIVCRLSQSEGIVADTDLSAEPIMLQITQSGSDKIVAPLGDDKSEIKRFRVADMVKCELFLGSKLLAQSSMSLFEYGYDLNYPVLKK